MRFLGGLGNQMFQYAAGLALATVCESDLLFDLEWFSKIRVHQGFELSRLFGIQIHRASDQDIRKVLGWRGSVRLRSHMMSNMLRRLMPPNYVIQPPVYHKMAFHSLPKDVYLDGYWQSEKYFLNIKEDLRQIFKFVNPLSSCNELLAAEIVACESVAIHVRRGDYFGNPNAQKIHGVDLSSYYHRAIAEMMMRVQGAKFYVFSDDPGWVRDNIVIPAPWVCIGHNREGESYIDMQLMSLCRHNIIANSTFSWWAGWLNANQAKVVIAPARWFNDESRSTADLYCSGWLAL